MREKQRAPWLKHEKVSFSATEKEYVLSFLLRNNVDFQGYFEAEGKSTIFVPFSEKEWLMNNQARGKYKTEGSVGRLYSLRKRLRLGLLTGVLLGAVLLFLSGMFVWDVRVSGNTSVDDDVIIDALREVGFGVGSFLPTADLDRIENAFLLHCDDIGWLSIHLSGSVAHLEVIEKKEMPPSIDRVQVSNLIAAFDAVIRGLAVKEGYSTVKVGEVVRAGDLLVSGVMTGEHANGFTEARGQIFGECEKEFSVTVEKEYTEKKTIFEKKQKITLNFFGYGINIFEDTGNSGGTYDTIYKESRLSFFGLFPLPIAYEETVALFYENTPCILSEAEILKRAQRELNAAVTAFLADGELLKRETEGRFTSDGAYTLKTKITCIVDIARPLPFTVEEKKD